MSPILELKPIMSKSTVETGYHIDSICLGIETLYTSKKMVGIETLYVQTPGSGIETFYVQSACVGIEGPYA